MTLDLDKVRAGACHPDCATIYAPYRRHAPECRADDILELADEIERLTWENRVLHAQVNLVRGRLAAAVAAIRSPDEESGDR